MDRRDVRDLNYIAPVENLRSILENGIFSHKRAKKIVHRSVAMQEIQDRRKIKVIPGGRPLHDYVNLYFDARNPMLYKRLGEHETICVLQINPSVMELPGVVIADANASSGYARFARYPEGLRLIDKELVYAEYWTHPDQIVEWDRKAKKCAEILVPDVVDPKFILRISVSCDEAKAACMKVTDVLKCSIDRYLFFR